MQFKDKKGRHTNRERGKRQAKGQRPRAWRHDEVDSCNEREGEGKEPRGDDRLVSVREPRSKKPYLEKQDDGWRSEHERTVAEKQASGTLAQERNARSDRWQKDHEAHERVGDILMERELANAQCWQHIQPLPFPPIAILGPSSIGGRKTHDRRRSRVACQFLTRVPSVYHHRRGRVCLGPL